MKRYSWILLIGIFAILFTTSAFAAGTSETETIATFSKDLWAWAKTAIIVVTTAIFMIAGIAYMTSGGNPNRVGFAKKLVTGAVSALLVLFLGEFFLKYVVGVTL